MEYILVIVISTASAGHHIVDTIEYSDEHKCHNAKRMARAQGFRVNDLLVYCKPKRGNTND